MANELAFAAPRAEEMTEVAIGMGSAGITGLAEGVIVKMAPGLGALEPVFTWGTLLGIPLVGAAGALFTRGMLSNLFRGVATGGVAVLGYKLPDLVAPFALGGRTQSSHQRGASRQLPAGGGVARTYEAEFETARAF